MHISHDELLDYLNNFKENQREAVYKAILDSNILESAFDTPEGKVILNNPIDVITDNVIKIVLACTDNKKTEAAQRVYPMALEINLAHKLLTKWARILSEGTKHKKTIKEKSNG